MRVTIIPEDRMVVIDGLAVQDVDMSGLDRRLRAVQWYHTSGEEEWEHRPNVRIKTMSGPCQRVVARAREMLRAEQEAAVPTKGRAAAAKKEEIRQYKRRLQAEPYDGVVPTRALFDLQHQCRWLPEDDPVPTPPPHQGHWVDSTGRARPFSCGRLIRFVDEIRARNARLWAVARQHQAAVDDLASDPARTADDIARYDHTIGWR